MRIVRTCSLAAIILFCLTASSWADSVTQSMVLAEYNVATYNMSQNWQTYESSSTLQSAFTDGKKADAKGLLLELFGFNSAAAAEFKIALNDFSMVANGLNGSMPDAGALGLLGCSGLVLLGALKRKFSH